MRTKISKKEQDEISHIAWGKYVNLEKAPEKEGKLKKFTEKVSDFGDRWNKATEGFWYNPDNAHKAPAKEDTDIMGQLFPDTNDNDPFGLNKMDLGI